MTIEHVLIEDPDIHEPKGVATAPLGSFYVADGTGSGDWRYTFHFLTLDIADITAVADYYIVSPFAGTIVKIYSVIDGTIASANKTLTASIGGVAVTNGAITIAYSGSAAGDVDSCTPTALNTVTAGQAIKIAAAGATTNAVRVHVTIQIQRTA